MEPFGLLPVREPAVAGLFYPGDASELAAMLDALLAAARTRTPAEPVTTAPKALIAPHAGYVYSGPTAALAYAQLALATQPIRRVVLLGPVHRVPIRGLALPGARAFATPLGEVPVDLDGARAVARLPQVVTSAAAHALEHSLEVHVPFLQTVLEEFVLLPLAVGDVSPDGVSEVLDVAWGGPETLVVVSSDLSHYLPYADACTVDERTVERILALDGTLSHHDACGATPVNGLLDTARRRGLRPHLLESCNSGDTAGDKRRVVGYAAVALTE
jgi:AmmeMemoRadiSam system protein B